jgi:hypothetical protein
MLPIFVMLLFSFPARGDTYAFTITGAVTAGGAITAGLPGDSMGNVNLDSALNVYDHVTAISGKFDGIPITYDQILVQDAINIIPGGPVQISIFGFLQFDAGDVYRISHNDEDPPQGFADTIVDETTLQGISQPKLFRRPSPPRSHFSHFLCLHY